MHGNASADCAPAAAAPATEAGEAHGPDPGQRRLEARLQRLEGYLGFTPIADAEVEAILAAPKEPEPAVTAAPARGETAGFESAIGEYLLARVGIVALCLGLAFLVAFPLAGLPSVLSSLIGYAAAGVFVAVAAHWHRTWPDTAGLLRGGAVFLLYFATLRLHFFSAQPVVASRALGLLLLLGANVVAVGLALRWQGELLAVFALGLSLVTGLLSDLNALQFGLWIVAAVAAWRLATRRGWVWLAAAALGMVLLAHLDWLLGHPLLGRTLRGASAPAGNLLVLAGYAIPLVATGCRRGAEGDALVLRIGRALLLAGGVVLVVALNVALARGQSGAPFLLAAGAALLVANRLSWCRQ